MIERLDDVSPSVVAEAIERNIIEQYPFIFSSLPQFEKCDSEKLIWYSSGFAHPYLNHILLARLNPGTIDIEIENILDEFRTRRLPVTWSIGPSSRPEDLGAYLTNHGLVHVKDEIGMVLDLSGKKNKPTGPAWSDDNACAHQRDVAGVVSSCLRQLRIF